MSRDLLRRGRRLAPVFGLATVLVVATVVVAGSATQSGAVKLHSKVVSPTRVIVAAPGVSPEQLAAKYAELDSHRAAVEAAELAAKNAPESGTGGPKVLAGGGPDGFGYVWADSNEPGGPMFSWVDITSTGTAMGLTDDAEGDALIGFNFPFYGALYGDARIGNNGGILLGTPGFGDVFSSNACPLPTTSGSDAPRLSVFWDDIYDATGNVYYETQPVCAHPDCGGACFVVEWYDRPHFLGGGNATFEAILCDSGDIIYQYLDLDFGNPSYDFGASASVGIEDEAQDAGYFLEVSCNAASLADNLAIRFGVPQEAGIDLAKTVGTDPLVCATTSEIAVAPGTDVTYCYTVANTGTVELTFHDLVDDQLGTILSGFQFVLAPGAAAFLTQTATITTTTVNTAVWTAYVPGAFSVTDTDSAVVTVDVPPAPLVCNGPVVTFDSGPPGDWTVVDNEGNGVVWTTIAGAGESGNYTNGSGDAATASSDTAGEVEFDTELRTPPFDTTGQFIVNLSYSANYQNFGGSDFLDVDVSTDGGSSWATALSWNEDHGGFRAPPGEDVSLDISSVAANQPSVIVRWRYYDPNTGEWAWYAQIDDASLTCEIPVSLQSIAVE